METMRVYIGGILHWLTGRRNELDSLISKGKGEIKRVLEKAKSSPIQETKPVIVQPPLKRPTPQRSDREESIPHANVSERLFQIGIVFLGICLIGLVFCVVLYLIIAWIMRKK
jgi:hypothetical protein